MEIKKGLYHGGCVGCAQAEQGGTTVCLGCQFFDANWNLPDKNDEHERRKRWKDKERERLNVLSEAGKEIT